MNLHIDTIIAKAGYEPDPATRAVVPPIHLATTYERAADGTYPGEYVYSRAENPTRRQFEHTIALLEGGAVCAAFSSGMAATMAVLQALRPGDHLIIPDDAYYGVRRALREIFDPWGLLYDEVDMTDLEAVAGAIRPATRLIWAETPSNPMLKITDLRAVAELARAAGVYFIVDSTWAPPVIQRPINLGADLVFHSITKYLAGHSDVLGGVIISRVSDEFFERIRTIQTTGGAVLDPFSAWLALRGVRSLAARLRIQCENARVVASFLESHDAVTSVHFPGLPSHPGHRIATGQMSDFGGMISMEVRGGREEAMRVASRVRVFTRATSLGGTESLIEHRASVEPPPTRTPESLLRLSIGLEHSGDLIADLDQALAP